MEEKDIEQMLKAADDEVALVNKSMEQFIAESKSEWSKEFHINNTNQRQYADYARGVLLGNLDKIEDFDDIKTVIDS